jgi:hypothetical protein
MPFENPEPGQYWGYRCVKCHEAITVWPLGRGADGAAVVLSRLIMNWDCQFQAAYPLSEIRLLEIRPAQT